MRPYRGKRKDNGEWVAGHYLTRRTKDNGLQHMISVQDMWGFHEVDPDTVGQYFGLDDHDDNQLFPGDIVVTTHTRSLEGGVNADPFTNQGHEEYEKVGVLEYYQGYQFGPRLRWNKGHLMIPNTSTLWRMKAKKIGNRWDHPHLLEISV